MHNQRLLTHILGAVSVVGLLSSQAAAELCYNGIQVSFNDGPPGQVVVTNRAFPGLGTLDALRVTCNVEGSGSTTGVGHAFINGVKKIQAFKASGVGGVGVEGLNASGKAVCTALDTTANGVGSAEVSCPSSAVTWRLSASF